MSVAVTGYVSRRFLSIVPVWLGLSLLAFSLSSLAPGDPAEVMLRQQTGEPPGTAEVALLRQEMGLDQPFPIRYGRWLADALRGDLGESYSTGNPVARTLIMNLPPTLELALSSLILAIILGVPLGVVAAAKNGTAIDHSLRFVSLVGASIPAFVLGYLLILILAVNLRLFPVAGSGGWIHLALPAMTLALAESAALARLTRSSMMAVLREDYVRTARAKGLRSASVLTRHALRNALNPVVTLLGLRFGRLLGGAVIVEIVFSRAGLGTVMIDAIRDRDYSMIQGFILFIGSVFVASNLIVDVVYSRLDPRVRLDSEKEYRSAPG